MKANCFAFAYGYFYYFFMQKSNSALCCDDLPDA